MVSPFAQITQEMDHTGLLAENKYQIDFPTIGTILQEFST